MKTKLTKKQRHEAYLYVYNSKEIIENCIALYFFCNDNFKEKIYINEIEYAFPELSLFKPMHVSRWYEYWFNNEIITGNALKENQPHRKTILAFCIEMTK